MKTQRVPTYLFLGSVALLSLLILGGITAGLVIAATYVAEAIGVPTEVAFVLVLAAFAALVFLLGTLLPKRHAWRASTQLPHTPAAVWQVLLDDGPIPALPASGSVVERLPDNQGRPVWRWTLKGGQQLTYEATEAIAPHRLAVRKRQDEVGHGSASQEASIGGEIAWDVEENDGGSRVTATTSVEIAKALLRPMIYLYILLAWRFHVRGLRQNLKFLAARLGE
jgi:uncharacterized protein YndB with AHSA1/START domain